MILGLGVTQGAAARFAEARIYIEYNSTYNDLGFHVFLDGEDWRSLRILNPAGGTIFEVEGKGGYKDLGLTELFFEGAEPSLDEFPLEDLLALFPEGKYQLAGTTVEGGRMTSTAVLTHAVPAGPSVSADVSGGSVVIRWEPVGGPPEGFPRRRIEIVGFQVIAGSFQVTLPSSSREVTLPGEFVQTLDPGEHEFEVLAIEAGGNQTITAGSFSTR
jgi:hypothetical protein